jgi:hypothetical protein
MIGGQPRPFDLRGEVDNRSGVEFVLSDRFVNRGPLFDEVYDLTLV